jgi:hypothetical protein
LAEIAGCKKMWRQQIFGEDDELRAEHGSKNAAREHP